MLHDDAFRKRFPRHRRRRVRPDAGAAPQDYTARRRRSRTSRQKAPGSPRSSPARPRPRWAARRRGARRRRPALRGRSLWRESRPTTRARDFLTGTPAAVSDPAWTWHFKVGSTVERERAVRDGVHPTQTTRIASSRTPSSRLRGGSDSRTTSPIWPVGSSPTTVRGRFHRQLEGLSYKTKLMVKLRLALPWSPVLAWPWGVEHVLEERDDGTVVVVRHLESWDVSAGEGVRQLFRSGPPGALAKASSSPRGAASSKAAPSPLWDEGPHRGAASSPRRATCRRPPPEQEAGRLGRRALGVGGGGQLHAEAVGVHAEQPERVQAVRGRTGRGRVRRGRRRRGHRGGGLQGRRAHVFVYVVPVLQEGEGAVGRQGRFVYCCGARRALRWGRSAGRLGARTGRTSVPAIFIDGLYWRSERRLAGAGAARCGGEFVPRLRGCGGG